MRDRGADDRPGGRPGRRRPDRGPGAAPPSTGDRSSTIDFPNADPFFHNVFSLSRGATFDLGRYPKGVSKDRRFTNAGLVKVYCHIHSHMTAAIMVFDHPFFRIPAADGTFTLDDVPAGSYEISAWHERIGESTNSIKVEPGRTARVDFALPMNVDQ